MWHCNEYDLRFLKKFSWIFNIVINTLFSIINVWKPFHANVPTFNWIFVIAKNEKENAVKEENKDISNILHKRKDSLT